jgi:hypothetical protein
MAEHKRERLARHEWKNPARASGLLALLTSKATGRPFRRRLPDGRRDDRGIMLPFARAPFAGAFGRVLADVIQYWIGDFVVAGGGLCGSYRVRSMPSARVQGVE